MCQPEINKPIKKEEKGKEQSSGESTPKEETKKVSELYDPGEYYLSKD